MPTALDDDARYAAVASRDRRYDGVFYTGVRTTGIYCRPSCPARTPARANVTFHPTSASAQLAGYRACKRCRPDATPGSPEWDVAATVAGRAMRLILDGVVDREGVPGLARRIGYAERHLNRVLTAELGAGPLALARAQRAQTARILIETTGLPFADVAFAAGFSSVRQFNDTVREVYAASPTELRGRRGGAAVNAVELRLAVRAPFAGAALLDFLRLRAVPGVEAADASSYARTLDLPHGPGTVRLELVDAVDAGTAFVPARFALTDLRDLAAAIARTRRLLDADADPVAVDAHLAGDPVLRREVRRTPGLRVPGHVDPNELAVRAVLGQQVSVAGARTLASRLVVAHGKPVATDIPGLTHLFPEAGTLAAIDPATLAMPRARARCLLTLTAALADGDVVLEPGPARDDVRRDLLALPGIGPWTAGYVAMRALGDPDVFLPTDAGVRHALARLAGPDRAPDPDRWAPWRSYALMHLWRM